MKRSTTLTPRTPAQPSPAPAGIRISSAYSFERLHQARVPLAVTLPLRAFLGITFLYAGIQKLTDPGFFHPHSRTYIGAQIAAFAHHSPIGGFLTAVALPHATLFGGLVAWGEVAIGLGTLAGILFRLAAWSGAFLSLILWLSATWQVTPYFYGADIFSLFGWITLALTGTAGALALDPWLGTLIQPRLEHWLGAQRAHSLLAALDMAPPQAVQPVATAKRRPRGSSHHSKQQSRRDFLQGAAAGVATMIAGLGIWNLLRPASSVPGTVTPTPPAGSTAAAGAGGNGVLATLNQMSDNSAVTFTIPNNQDPGVLIRLASGKVVAFDATCTHAGCAVQYDPSSRYLICPCHGATFDPTNNAAVLDGPTDQPLAPVAINVNQQTGAITLQ